MKHSHLWKDFKRVAAAQEKKHFTFFPEGLITTPDEFVEELSRYAKENHRKLVMTKASMFPEFTLDGLPYSACRLTTVIGSYVKVELTRPLLVEDLPPARRRWMEMVWRYGVPAAFWLGVIALLIGSRLQ